MMTGPVPPEGTRWCGICASLFKKACLDAVNDEIQQAIRGDAKDGPYWIDLGEIAREHHIPPPAVGVTMTLSTVIDGALLEGCWSHAKPIQLTTLATAGNGAVPLLGQPQGRG